MRHKKIKFKLVNEESEKSKNESEVSPDQVKKIVYGFLIKKAYEIKNTNS